MHKNAESTRSFGINSHQLGRNYTADVAIALADGDLRPGASKIAPMKAGRLYECAWNGVQLTPDEAAKAQQWAAENNMPWPVKARGRRRSKKTA